MMVTDPAVVGLSAARLARVHEMLQGYIDQGRLPGAVTLLARRGKLLHCEAYGMMDREAGTPMRTDTIFRLTIHQLLTHTSGLSYSGLAGTPLATQYADAAFLSPLLRLQWPLDRLADKLATLPLVRQPGTAWHYSLSQDVVGRLIEVVSGMPFDRFLAERLFKPLGMHDTGFCVPADKVDRFAAMYGPATEAGLPLLDAPATSLFTSGDYYPSGGSGLVGTAPDYLRFAQMLLNGGELDGTRLLSRKTVEWMTRNHLPANMLPSIASPEVLLPGYGYGLGFGVLMDPGIAGILGSTGQYGWDGAARTQFWVDPQEEMIGVSMSQVLPWPSAPLFNQLYQVLAHQAIID